MPDPRLMRFLISSAHLGTSLIYSRGVSYFKLAIFDDKGSLIWLRTVLASCSLRFGYKQAQTSEFRILNPISVRFWDPGGLSAADKPLALSFEAVSEIRNSKSVKGPILTYCKYDRCFQYKQFVGNYDLVNYNWRSFSRRPISGQKEKYTASFWFVSLFPWLSGLSGLFGPFTVGLSHGRTWKRYYFVSK